MRSGPSPNDPAAKPSTIAPKKQIPPALNGCTVGSTGRSTRIAPIPNIASGAR